MTTCVRCSAAVTDGSRFCPSCGSSVAAPSTSQTPTVVSDRSFASVSRTDPGRRGRFVAGELLSGRYRIEGLLGKGGMGEVYRAEDLRLGQSVALKFLPAELATHPSMLARFHNEVRLARQVTHANVCRVHDLGEVDGQPYITMEYVDGEHLGSLLRRIGRLPQDKAVEIARQICAGLAAAHDRGVLHRDLKPENVMIDGRGTVRIMDFGLAGIGDELKTEDLRSGTPAYMAPEQMEGREVTVRSDLYALGLVLYEMFTGRPIFDAPTLEDLRRQRERFEPRRSIDTGGLDPAIERVVMRCLEKDPAKRPVSALAVAVALPGGDPLRAALAAGEMPSPEMVAASGPNEGLRAGTAWLVLGAAVAVFVAASFLLGRHGVLAAIPLDKPPEALAERARQILVAAGSDSPAVNTAWAFGRGVTALEWAEARPGRDEWEVLKTGRLGVLSFWYRQAPRRLRPLNANGRLVPDDPSPADVSGDATVFLDDAGRLASLTVTPEQILPEATAPAGEPDWKPLFDAAGLDMSKFVLTPPKWSPPVWADHTTAWAGTIPEIPDAALRVEGASARGKIVYFDLVYPWDQPRRTSPRAPTAGETFSQTLNVALLLAALVAAGSIARRNILGGRADRRGAWRIGVVTFGLTIAQWALFANHQTSAPREWGLLIQGTGLALFIGGFTALLYLGLEPIVRKAWPDVMISWTRLLAGGWRDPLVARDVLFGVAICAALTLLVGLARWGQSLAGHPPTPLIPDMDGTLGVRAWIGQLCSVAINAVLSPMLILLLLAGLRAWLKSTARGLAVAALILAPVFAVVGYGQGGPVLAAVGILQIGVLFWMLVRFGLLTVIVSSVVGQVLGNFPLVSHVGAWYWGYGAAALATVVAAATWAAIHASRRAPSFSER